RVHEAQVAEPEVLQRSHDVRDVDEVLGLVEDDDDAHKPLTPNAERGMRNAEQQGRVVRRAALTLTFRVPRSHFRVRIIPPAQHPEPTLILPVPPQPDPSVAAAPDELPRAPHAAREHLVDDQVEADAATDVRTTPVGRRDRRRDAIPGGGTAPGPTYHLRPAGRPARPAPPHPT